MKLNSTHPRSQVLALALMAAIGSAAVAQGAPPPPPEGAAAAPPPPPPPANAAVPQPPPPPPPPPADGAAPPPPPPPPANGAAPPPPPPPPANGAAPPPPPHDAPPGHERLKEQLKLTEAQEGAWKQFTDAMHPPAPPAPPAQREDWRTLTTPQRLDRMQDIADRHHAEMRRRSDAIRAFYGHLTPKQQKVFDDYHARRLHPGHGKHAGSRPPHERPQHAPPPPPPPANGAAPPPPPPPPADGAAPPPPPPPPADGAAPPPPPPPAR